MLELCEEKTKEKKDKLIREAAEVKMDKDVREVVNRGRQRRRAVQGNIKKEEWGDYFIELLSAKEKKGENR